MYWLEPLDMPKLRILFGDVMDAVNKKAIRITRIWFIMFQYFHSESSGSGFSYLC